MAVKTRYCGHEHAIKIFRRSKSSRLHCCKECYYKEVRKVCVEMFGEEFTLKLDKIKLIDMSRAFND